jgi:hypothetical protein
VSLRQKKLKRLLAYSSISHVGYLLLAFSANSLEGIQSLFASDVNWISLKSELKKKVLSKEVSPFEASRQLLHSLKEKL